MTTTTLDAAHAGGHHRFNPAVACACCEARTDLIGGLSLATLTTCPTCGERGEVVDGSAIYPHRPPSDFGDKRFWACTRCRTWVGCRPGGTMPLGRMADAATRAARSAAHRAFDPLWWNKRPTDRPAFRTRGGAYSWLARKLGLEIKECHMGLFDIATCSRVIETCRRAVEELQGHGGRT